MVVTTQFGSRDVSVSASFQLDTSKRLKLRFVQGSISQPTFNSAASLSSILHLVSPDFKILISLHISSRIDQLTSDFRLQENLLRLCAVQDIGCLVHLLADLGKEFLNVRLRLDTTGMMRALA